MKPSIPSFLSDEASKLLSKILNKDPTKRIAIDHIRTDPWCHQESSMLNHIYQKYKVESDVPYADSLKPVSINTLLNPPVQKNSSSETHKTISFLNPFDQTVIDKMKTLSIPGIEGPDRITRDLNEQKFNEVTATYKILKRIKENEIFSKYLKVNSKTEIPHTHSDMEKYHNGSHLISPSKPSSIHAFNNSPSGKKMISISSKKGSSHSSLAVATFH